MFLLESSYDRFPLSNLSLNKRKEELQEKNNLLLSIMRDRLKPREAEQVSGEFPFCTFFLYQTVLALKS